MPAVEFELSTLGSAQTIRTDGVTEWKYVFQPSPPSKNKVNPGRSQFSVAIKESIYILVLAEEALHIEIIWERIKIIASLFHIYVCFQ
jgi:hypothetical protein